MGIYATKPHFQRALAPIMAFCAQRRIHPDVFTYGAMVCSAGAGIALGASTSATASGIGLIAAAGGMVLRLGLNLMDGLVARATNTADAFGEVKNEFGDRISDVLVFAGLLWGGQADARLAGLALALVLCVSYLGIFSKALGGPRLYTGAFGKGDRMLSLALACIIAACAPLYRGWIFNGYLVMACALAALTIVQRLRVIVVHIQQGVKGVSQHAHTDLQ